MGVRTVRDQCTTRDHQGEIQVAIERLHQEYRDSDYRVSVNNIKRVKTMTLLWGENITEIYYDLIPRK